MIRAPWGDEKYWDSREALFRKTLQTDLHEPSPNPGYLPQFCFDHSQYALRLVLVTYSRGDSVHKLQQHFEAILKAWELSNQLADGMKLQLKPGEGWDHRHLGTAPLVSSDSRSHSDPRAWAFQQTNLNHYNLCFWLVGLALLLDVPDAQWKRLLTLVGGEGEDELLDRIIASRETERRIGDVLLHAKPYARLLKAVKAPKERQAKLLKDFVDHWYVELARKGGAKPYWYIYGDPVKHPLSMGSYFGRWCIEAAAAVKAFGLDDSLCLGHEHYPGDLLRPDGPSTHPKRVEPRRSLLARLLGRK